MLYSWVLPRVLLLIYLTNKVEFHSITDSSKSTNSHIRHFEKMLVYSFENIEIFHMSVTGTHNNVTTAIMTNENKYIELVL